MHLCSRHLLVFLVLLVLVLILLILVVVVSLVLLFRSSRLVQNDERDRHALAAARKLGTIGAELVSGPDAALAAADTSQLARILARKVWERRSALPAVSRRVLLKFVEQTETRLGA